MDTKQNNLPSVKIITVICLLLTFATGFSKEKRQTVTYTGTQIVGTAPLMTVMDNEAPPYPYAFFNARRESFVELKVDDYAGPYYWYTIQVNIQVTPATAYGTWGTPYNVSLKVENNHYAVGTGEYVDFQAHKVNGGIFGARVDIVSIQVLNIDTGLPETNAPANVSLTVAFEAERYYTLPSSPPTSITGTFSSTNRLVTINWADMAQAEEYEVEWTWVDRYHPTSLNSVLSASSIPLTSREFSQNCTRVQTKNSIYEIPSIFGKGFLVYRVRAVGRFPDADFRLKFYGPWSSNPGGAANVSNWTYVAISLAHEETKNWQFQASYAEEGKKKDVVSYFDGTLRNRQTVTRINTDNQAIVGEVIYDEEGRPAVEVLPVPAGDTKLMYYPNFNRNITSEVYSYKDLQPESTGSCDFMVDGMSASYGASKYYSTGSITNTKMDYVPNAELYPFSQTEYTQDNTGRIKRKGGVGPDHQLGSGHEMKYIYSIPSQEELNRLFGYSVGFTSHYKKNVVIDPNGQVSVSYIDPQGRTIATALGSDNPGNLTQLADEGDNALHQNITIDLLNKQSATAFDTTLDNNEIFLSTGYYGNIPDGLRYDGQRAFITEGTNYAFEYKLSKTSPFVYKCGGTTYTYPTHYRLDIDITDECGSSVLPSTVQHSYQIGSSHPLTHTIPASSFTISPPVGAYGITKQLVVNHEQLELFADDYIKKGLESGCILGPQSPNVDFTDCFYTCEECVNHYTQIGQTGYVNQMLDASSELNQFEEGTTEYNELLGLLTLRYEREWELIIEECQKPCAEDGFVVNPQGNENVTSMACDNILNTMMADMMPSGQYGLRQSNVDENGNIVPGTTLQPDPATLPLSVYNDTPSNEMFAVVKGINPANVNWRYPHYFDYQGLLGSSPPNSAYMHYFTELGEIDYVEVLLEDGVYTPAVTNPTYLVPVVAGSVYKVEPQHLANVEDFIEAINSRPHWTLSLVKYHPEFHYLDYTYAICNQTSDIDFWPSNPNNPVVRANSDGFDALLGMATTFAEAQAAGYLQNWDTLFKNDPYFDYLHPLDATHVVPDIVPISVAANNSANKNTPSGYLQARRSIMEQSLIPNSSTYENDAPIIDYTSPFSNGGNNQGYEGTGIKSMFMAIYETVRCNGLDFSCDLTGNAAFGTVMTNVINDFTVEEQDLFWQYYVSYYISLKQKIQFSFRSLHAANQGFYNDCIGNNNEENLNRIKAVLNNYPAERDAIDDNAPSGDWLDEPNVTLYEQIGELLEDKEKRFPPYDEQYNSEGSAEENYAGMLQEADAQYYASTGLCPMARDLELFLDQAVKKASLKNVFKGSTPSPQPVINFLTPALFQGLGANYSSTNFSTNSFIISGSLSNANKTVAINLTQSPASPNFVPIKLTIPASSGLTWNNYGTSWVIQSITNLAPTGYDGGTQLFGFSVIATVQPLPGTATYELELKGTTKASLHCSNDPDSPEANNPANGPVIIVENVSQMPCDKKESFEAALKNLINTLIASGTVNSTSGVNLLSYPAYTDSYLPEFFTAQNATYAVWKKHASASYYYIYIGTPTMNTPRMGLTLNLSQQLNEFNVGVLNGNDTAHLVSAETVSGTSITGEINDTSVPLEFACCRVTNSESYVLDDYFTLSKQLYNEIIDLVVYCIDNGLPIPTEYDSPTVDALANYYNTPNFGVYNLTYGGGMGPYAIQFFHGLGTSGAPCIVPVVINAGQYFGDSIRIENIYNHEFQFQAGSGDYYEVFDYYNFKFTNGTVQQQGNLRNACLKSFTNLPACPCIPQVPKPVTAEAKYTLYTNHLTSFGLTNYITNSAYTDFEVFKGLNLQYIVDGYLTYLSTLGITSGNYSTHPQYISLTAFGSSGLNYGYNDYATVITAFKNQLINPNPITDWVTFVDYYLEQNPGICPPAPMIPKITLPVTPDNPCKEFHISVAETYNAEAYAAYLQNKKDAFKKAYIEDALSKVVETFTLNYKDKEYQYTLYYYDQAGNLIQTVAPQGVTRLPMSSNASINSYRAITPPPASDNTSLLPSHTFKTQYKYNTLNQLVWQQTPDGGVTRFAYDALGRIVASQNAKQSPLNDFSYTRYDGLGRIIEAGEMRPTTALTINDQGRLVYTSGGALVTVTGTYPYSLSSNCYEVTRTLYDSYAPFVADDYLTPSTVRNVRNRVTVIATYPMANSAISTNAETAIFYNYDIHGNVEEMVQYIGSTIANLSAADRLSRVNYEYDLISGNVNKVIFQRGQADQFIHKYTYDADNRITSVSTSKDGIVWEKDAEYEYYPHGPLARTLIGDKKVQGIDFAYTLQGWLKTVNSENFNHIDNDMGSDGNVASQDAFGYSLGYYNGDYLPRAGSTVDNQMHKISKQAGTPIVGTDLFNGNIKRMVTSLRSTNESVRPSLGGVYYYDQLNRIMAMTGYNVANSAGGGMTPSSSIFGEYTYDKNGNILTLNRKAPLSGSYPFMDRLEYTYAAGTNKLRYVRDQMSPSQFSMDIDDQLSSLLPTPDPVTGNNYFYDEIGQLTRDNSERLLIDWRIDGKVQKVTKNYIGTSGTYPQITFYYNGMGNRVAKKVSNSSSSHTITLYKLDAQGNTLAVNEAVQTSGTVNRLKEHHIYGSSRLGVQENNGTSVASGFINRLVGDKRFELSNHLGNVVSVVTDRKITKPAGAPVGDFAATFIPDVITYSDYYPFGMIVPDPAVTTSEYRYGFNGKEKDNEIKGGDGKSYDYGERTYDPRIGRFIKIDAYANVMASHSPYSYALNNPLYLVDEDGNWPKPSDLLPKDTSPLIKGIVDGVWEGITGTAGFVYDYATDAKFRAKVNAAFKALVEDPMGTVEGILEEYAGKIERLATGKATYQDKYDAGMEIGEAGVAILLGGATLTGKIVKKTLKPRMSGGKVAKEAKQDAKNARPSWQDSESDALSGTDYDKQKSFKDGKEVPYGTKGSVRPEGHKVGSSLEVKNYDLSKSSGVSNLINNVSKQINQRVDNLPEGTRQNIVIDVRGQKVSEATMKNIVDKIGEKTKTKNYKVVFKTE